jgi:hypothetical protein
MSTSLSARSAKPRVWLAGGQQCPPPTPTGPDRPVVSDGSRRWIPGQDGLYHTEDGRHHHSWTQLRDRSDLVEVPTQ